MSRADPFETGEGIALTLFNVYSSLMLKTRLSTVIFDPVKLNLDRPDFDSQDIDAIIISHEHADHFDEKLALEMQRRSGAPVITTPFVAKKVEQAGGKARGLRIGESVKINDLAIFAENCVHPANQPLSFIIKAGAVTVYHPADSEPFSAMKEISSKYKSDIVLYTGTSREGLKKIAEVMRPRVVVSNFSHGFADIEIPGVELKILKQFETYIYP